jgi:hypothetical protein
MFTKQLVPLNFIKLLTQPRGLGVVVKADHGLSLTEKRESLFADRYFGIHPWSPF